MLVLTADLKTAHGLTMYKKAQVSLTNPSDMLPQASRVFDV